MSFEVFKQKVEALIARADNTIKVRFSTDSDEGKHIARCLSGDNENDVVATIVGNSASLSITVRWGSGHQAMAKI